MKVYVTYFGWALGSARHQTVSLDR